MLLMFSGSLRVESTEPVRAKPWHPGDTGFGTFPLTEP